MAKKNEKYLPEILDDPKCSDICQLLFSASLTENGYVYVAKYFDDFSENQRREKATFCLDWYDFLVKYSSNPFHALPPVFPEGANTLSAFLAAKIAIVACCSYEEITKALAETGVSTLDRPIEHLLRSRHPAWTSKFLHWIVRIQGMENFYGWGYWKTYRRFLKEGIAEPIPDEVWTRMMFSCMLYKTQSSFGDHEAISLYEQIRKEPDLLETDIWNIFELTQFPRGANLTSIDMLFSPHNILTRTGDDWKGTICTLVKNGEMSKSRVLDGCLRSLDRPFTDHESKWYVQLLEQLIDKIPVTDDELAEDSKRYLDLIENANSTPRALGIKILEHLFKSGKLPDREIMERTASILREPAKAKAKKAITILDRIAKKNPGLRNGICSILLEGLRHESADVQQAAGKVLERYRALDDPGIADIIKQTAGTLAPSVRKLLHLEEHADDANNISTYISSRQESTTPPIGKTAPVQTFEELLDLATRLLEDPNDIDDVERLLDGLARIGSIRSKDFDKRTAPLLKRAMKLLRIGSRIVDGIKVDYLSGYPPFAGHNLHADIKYLVIVWITRTMPYVESLDEPFDMYIGSCGIYSERDRLYKHQVIIGNKKYYYNDGYYKSIPVLQVFSARCKEIAMLLSKDRSAQLLAAPTHQGGWIDPIIFVERLASGDEHSDADRVLALLRLTNEGRAEALELLDAKFIKRYEYIEAVSYALGAGVDAVGKTPHYWIAAARCRSPLSNDAKVESVHQEYGPDAGTAATYVLKTGHVLYSTGNVLLVDRFPALSEENMDMSLFPSVALHLSDPAPWSERPGLYPWTFQIWPQNPAPATATSIDVHARNIDKNYDWGFRHALYAIARRGTPFHPMAVTAIFTGLAMKSPLVHTTAIDTTIVTVTDNRLTVDVAAIPIRELLALNILTLSRWVKPLKTIAEQSDRHGIFVHQLLEYVVDSFSMKDSTAFLEILYELGISLNRNVREERCRRFLSRLTGTGKAAKLAKKLLQL